MPPVRALLLTDVVDSTQLSERLGDAAMAGVWTEHDRVARALLPQWRGREIDKTDGMLLLFERADDAVHYAQAYHRALGSMAVPLRARAGLHVGPVLLRENPADDVRRGAKPLEVDGMAKPTAARVMALAAGGQTLLTPQAREALGESTWSLASCGHWVLKGVAEPVELFRVLADTDPGTPPPDADKAYRVVRRGERWVPVREIPNNLPQTSTSFIGRERELDDVKRLLAGSRLLTLTGMGGLGKTRLSLQAAEELKALFPDGAWFLDLAPIRDPSLVADEAARVLGVAEEPGQPLLTSLGRHLQPKRLLLILDNCEHLLAACAELAHVLLQAAPDLRLMASSREVLHVPGEQVYPILPLPLPRPGDDLDALGRSTAVRLFVDRAQRHKPGFTLTAAEAPAVADLVAQLEGIPLALELAAARVRSLSVADIHRRLKDRYKLLTGGDRVLQQRQQTLRALVDWSYELLTPDEQIALNRLGVFAGGFDLDAAEAVCGVEPLEPDGVLDLLGSLIDKSLVMPDDSGGSTRYRMLETIREYARAKLGDDEASTAARHGLHYFELAKQAARGLHGPEQAGWVERLETEIDNLRAAMDLALAGGMDPFIAVKLPYALLGFWLLRGYATEGRARVKAALALPAVRGSDIAQAHALYAGAGLATSQGDHAEAQRMLEDSLALRRRLGQPVDIAMTLSTLTLSRLQAGDAARARAGEEEALALFRQSGDRIGEAIGLLHLAQVALWTEADDEAEARLSECLALAREIEHLEVEADCERALAELHFQRDRIDLARGHAQRGWAICHDAADKHGEASAQSWLARIALAEGELAASREALVPAIAVFREGGMVDELMASLEVLAGLAAARGEPALARRVAAAVDGTRTRLALARSPREARRWAAQVEIWRAAAPAGDGGDASELSLDALIEQALQVAAPGG